jgi:hypothetical protein
MTTHCTAKNACVLAVIHVVNLSAVLLGSLILLFATARWRGLSLLVLIMGGMIG